MSVRTIDLPDLGACHDDSSFVADRAGSGRHLATALLSYVQTGMETAAGLPYNVKLHGAIGDGAADDTAAINAAIAAVPAGGAILFPPGTYKVSAAIAVNKNLTILGFGRYASTLITTHATADLLTVTAQVDIQGLGFWSSVTRTNGAFVSFGAGSGRSRLRDFFMFQGFHGVRILLAAVSDYTISDGEMLNWFGVGCGILIDAGLAVLVSRVLMQQGARPGTGFGIRVTGTGDVQIESCQLLSCGTGLSVAPIAGAAQASLWAGDTYFDNCATGVALSAVNAAIARAKFVGCWMSSSDAQGVSMSTSAGGSIGGIDLIGCHIFDNGDSGVHAFDSGVFDVNIDGCAIAGNTQYGVSMTTTHPFRVTNCRIGNSYGFGNNVAGGIYLGTGCDGYVIDGNQLSGNTGPAISGPALYGGTNAIIRDNVGWKTETGGVATLNSGLTTMTVAHGLDTANGQSPLPQHVQLQIITGLGTAKWLAVTATTTTVFTVLMDAVAGGNVSFGWHAHMPAPD